MSVQLVIMCEPRVSLVVEADCSGDHYHGNVLDILPDYTVTEHYFSKNPFLVVTCDCDRDDVEYLLEPLTCMATTDYGEEKMIQFLRCRYGLDFTQLSDQKQIELFGSGCCNLSLDVLESIVYGRSV
jgi:hypothetical protein